MHARSYVDFACSYDLRFNFDEPQTAQVLSVFDPSGDGTVEKKEFMIFCENADVAGAVRHALEVKAKSLESKKMKDNELLVSIQELCLSLIFTTNLIHSHRSFKQEIVVRIHREIGRLAASLSSNDEPDFRAMFDSMDEDGDGFLATDEFLKSLRKMG